LSELNKEDVITLDELAKKEGYSCWAEMIEQVCAEGDDYLIERAVELSRINTEQRLRIEKSEKQK